MSLVPWQPPRSRLSAKGPASGGRQAGLKSDDRCALRSDIVRENELFRDLQIDPYDPFGQKVNLHNARITGKADTHEADQISITFQKIDVNYGVNGGWMTGKQVQAGITQK